VTEPAAGPAASSHLCFCLEVELLRRFCGELVPQGCQLPVQLRQALLGLYQVLLRQAQALLRLSHLRAGMQLCRVGSFRETLRHGHRHRS
jgi:hypothetical protein